MCQQESTSDSPPTSDSLEVPLLPQSDDESNNAHHPPSRNIRLTLLFTVVAFAGRSLWSQSVLSTFVYLLRDDDPKAVGFITAAMGIAQLLSSFPAGILADRYRRDVLLKIASVIGLIAIGLAYTAVIVKESYIWLTIALSVWGIFWGITNTSLGALFADSIQHGERSKYFTQRSILLKFGNMTGPATAFVLFAVLGNTWSVHDCAIVMAVGNIVCVPAIMLLCFLNDDNCEQEDEVECEGASEPLLTDEPTTAIQGDNDEDDQVTATRQWLPEKRIVPILISMADIISGLGSGMSIRYFPIFFLDNLQMSPVLVQVLYIISPMAQAVLMHCGQKWSKTIGRCRMTILYKWTGIAFMVLMTFSYRFKLPSWATCIFYVLRTSFMNATSPLTKSILMDAVPKEERGKWSAMESVNMFGWSGSAVLGGILVGSKGILFNFGVTASVQFLATLPIIALLSRDVVEATAAIRLVQSRPRLSIVEDPETASSDSNA
jgi:MFS family permease